MDADLTAQLEAAHGELDNGNIGAVRAAIDAALSGGADASDVRLLHLQAKHAWASDEFDDAVVLFERAIEGRPADPRVYIDAGELFADLLDFDGAEDVLRSLLEREDIELDVEQAAEAKLLLAQARLSHIDGDPEEALELLDEIDASVHGDPAWLCVRAAALGALDRHGEAISMLTLAVDNEDDFDNRSELLYQLGLAHRAAGDEAKAVACLLEVRAQDISVAEAQVDVPIPADESEDLRRQLESLLETLPDPILKQIGTVPIRVERWVSEAQIRAGVDPRSALVFEGQPATPEGGGAAKADALVLFRDMIVASIETDDEIEDVLIEGMLDELSRFFDIEGLIPGN